MVDKNEPDVTQSMNQSRVCFLMDKRRLLHHQEQATFGLYECYDARSPKHHVGIYRYKERVLIGVLHHTPSSFFAHLL